MISLLAFDSPLWGEHNIHLPKGALDPQAKYFVVGTRVTCTAFVAADAASDIPTLPVLAMSDDLVNEREAINSIYGEHTLVASADSECNHYFLTTSDQSTVLRLSFPPCYPEKPPEILGTVTVSESLQKGQRTHILTLAQEVLSRVFMPGAVCIFDFLQELDNQSSNGPPPEGCPASTDGAIQGYDEATHFIGPRQELQPLAGCASPQWIASSIVTVKKSVFVARACPVSSPLCAKAAVDHLLMNDKRVAKATHNITAYRTRVSTSSADNGHLNEIVYQDCNDDGETAAGGRLLHLLQLMDVWGLCVVVSRWYGGVQLGPDRTYPRSHKPPPFILVFELRDMPWEPSVLET